ncbi:hypothetical protein LTR95_007888 [Oleoguttula sp. CCFEE 5521]
MAQPSITKDQLRRAIDHVFLPPQLPQSSDEQSDCTLVNITRKALGALLKLLSAREKTQQHDAVKRAMTAISNLARINSLDGGNIDAQALVVALKSIKHGDTLAVRISAQNAAVLISADTDKLIVQQFELSPLNEQVMGCTGRLIRKFPGSAIEMPSSRLTGGGFVNTLAETLATMCIQPAPGMQPKTSRTGSHHVELRNTTDCAMISEFFMAYLRAHGTPNNCLAITKHSGRCALARRRDALEKISRVAPHPVCEAIGGSRALYKEVMVYIPSEVLRSAQDAENDVLQMMMMKIERRRKKLTEIMLLPAQVAADVDKVLGEISGITTSRWDLTQTADCRNPNLSALADLDFVRDASVSLPLLEDHLAGLHMRSRGLRSAPFVPTSWLLEFSDEHWPKLPELAFKDETYTAANLCNFEDWVAQ